MCVLSPRLSRVRSPAGIRVPSQTRTQLSFGARTCMVRRFQDVLKREHLTLAWRSPSLVGAHAPEVSHDTLRCHHL